MWRCTSSTTASVKNPRATPDWLVIEDDPESRRDSARGSRHGPRIQLHALHAIEIADFLDQRAVAIEEHRRLTGVTGGLVAASTASTVMPVMHRWSAGTRASMQGRHQHRVRQHGMASSRSDASRARWSDRTWRSPARRGPPRNAWRPSRWSRACGTATRTPASVGRSVRPDQIERAGDVFDSRRDVRRGCGDPPRCRRARPLDAVARPAHRPAPRTIARGQRFAPPNAAPGATATSGARPVPPCFREQRTRRARAARRTASMPRLDRSTPFEAERAHEVPVVLGLMHPRRRRHAARQQQRAQVGPISPALGNAGAPRRSAPR